MDAGVTSIYWYFRSKSDLLQAAADSAAHPAGSPLVRSDDDVVMALDLLVDGICHEHGLVRGTRAIPSGPTLSAERELAVPVPLLDEFPATQAGSFPETARRAGGRRAYGSLSEVEIVRETRSLLERGGLEALSMATVARALDASSTSLYWYFGNTQALLAAVVDNLAAELYAGLPALDGEAHVPDVEAYYRGLRQALVTGRAYGALLEAEPGLVVERTQAVGVTTGAAEGEVAALSRLAVDPVQLRRLCLSYVFGYAAIELGVRREGADSTSRDAAVALASSPQLDRNQFRVLYDLAGPYQILTMGGVQFDKGLHLLLTGAAVPRPAGAAGRRLFMASVRGGT